MATIPVWLGTASDKVPLSESQIVLTDFGEAFDPTKTKRLYSNTVPTHRPPEALFAGAENRPLSFSADVWTLGCTLWELMGQCPPFISSYGSPESVLADQIGIIGRESLPNQWWELWGIGRKEYFNDQGLRVDDDSYPARTWSQRFEYHIQEPRREKGISEFTDDERTAFLRMIKSMLVFEPSERAGMDDIVGCEWVRRWAKADYTKMNNDAQE